MKKLPQLFFVFVALVVLSGCSTPAHEKIKISAVIVDPESLVLISFTNLGYSEWRVLIRVTAPEEMKGEVLAVLFSTSWGRKVTTYGDISTWQKPVATPVNFVVKRRDITNKSAAEQRCIFADKLREVIWEERG